VSRRQPSQRGRDYEIENLAFEAGEMDGDDSLADALARLADIYCNDAFALSHESEPPPSAWPREQSARWPGDVRA